MEKLKLEDFIESNESLLTDEEIENGFNDSVVNLKETVERPPILLSIGIDDKSYGGVHYPLKFARRGDFSIITGLEKSRKSFVKSLLEACAFGGESNKFTDYLEIKSHGLNKDYVISIDAEQSKYDVWLNGVRIPKMVGAYPENYKVMMWREKSKKEKLAYLDWFFMRSPYRDKLGLVFIDGYVDFIYDPNNQTECNIFWDSIMKYSSVCNCHISGVLHTNPGDAQKMRGHAGTIGGQKAETVMHVENKGEYSLISCKSIRGSKPFKDFTIRIDDNHLPYVSIDDEIEFDFKK